MTSPRQEMACATCLSPLNVFNGAYIHPLHRHADGHTPVPVAASRLETVNRVCDFCGNPYPMWALTGAELSVLGVGADSDLLESMSATWAACVPCMSDIDAGQAHRIADRIARSRLSPGNLYGHAQIAELHQAFLRHRQPGRTLVTTTAWPDLQLNARDLPKVRDRLAAFYRGGDQLPTALHLDAMRGHLADSLDRARLYWIDSTFTDLAEHAATQLAAVTADRDLAPCDDGLLVWSRSATTRRITAISWSSHDDTLHIVAYRAIGAGLDDVPQQQLRNQVGWLAPMRTLRLHYGQPAGDHSDPGSAILLSTWLLIAQKAAQAVPADIDKAVRKRYARDKRPLPDVRIVRIRARPQASTTGTPTGTGRAHTSRVWVTGHWRNQAYGPRRTLRRPVYIHPFLRGPEDAPIKLSTTVRLLGAEPDHTDPPPAD